MYIFYKISFLVNSLWACVDMFKAFVEVSSRRSVGKAPVRIGKTWHRLCRGWYELASTLLAVALVCRQEPAVTLNRSASAINDSAR
jgi:urea transporter